MALIKCTVCKKEISENAEACPNCGEPMRRKKIKDTPSKKSSTLNTGCLTLVAVLGVLFVLAMFSSGGSDRGGPIYGSEPDTDNNEGIAWMMAQRFVKERLKSPSTAEFPKQYNLDSDAIRRTGDNYKIMAYVDSENAFGATLRREFSMNIRYTGEGNWKLIELEFD